MAVCEICGKGTSFGRKVSHAGNRNLRARRANLQRVRAFYAGRRVTTVCTRCLKSSRIVKIA